MEITFIPNITLFTQLLSHTSTPPYPCFFWTVSSLATDDRHIFVYPASSTNKDFGGSPLHNLKNILKNNAICEISKLVIFPQFIFNIYIEQQAETVLNQVLAIYRCICKTCKLHFVVLVLVFWIFLIKVATTHKAFILEFCNIWKHLLRTKPDWRSCNAVRAG